MSWGNTFNRHKATGMDPSAAAFIADQSEPARKKKVDNDEATHLLSAALDLCIQMMNDNGLHLPHTIEKAREAQEFAGTYPSPQPRSAITKEPTP
jgi:hypothetical protein